MKRVVLCLIFAVCLPLLHAQKTRYGQAPPKAKPGVDYPIALHVSGIHYGSYCGTSFSQPEPCGNVLFADALVDGKKVEMMGDWIWFPKYYTLSLTPGDYQARLVKPAPAGSKTLMFEQYELLLPDRTVWRCTVTGLSE